MENINDWLNNEKLNKDIPHRLTAAKYFKQLILANFEYLVKYCWSFTKDGYVYFLNNSVDSFDGKIYRFSRNGEHIAFNSFEEMILEHYNLPKLSK
jgi:hypothetical protein